MVSFIQTNLCRLLFRLFLVCCLLSFAASISCDSEKYAYTSPGLLIDSYRIEAIKKEIAAGNPVIVEAYKKLITDADQKMNKSPDPIKSDFRVPGFYKNADKHRAGKGNIAPDSKSAFCLALAYAISGDKKYGLKSKDFLFAWVNNLGKPKDAGSFSILDIFDPEAAGGDTRLVITYTFPNFICAFDILDGLGLLSPQETESFRKWLRVYVNYSLKEVYFKNNHHNWQSLFLMSSGLVLRDNNLFERGVKYFKNGFKGQILKDGAMPMELWRKKKCGSYTLMALEAMLQGAYIASKNGHLEILDIKSDDKGGIKDAVNCLTTFLDDPDNWQTKRRKSYQGYTKQNRPDDKSDWGWIFEIPYYLWKDEKYLNYMLKRPYGDATRTYTLEYSTLLFTIRINHQSPLPLNINDKHH